jgi:hypothetical protein
MVAIAAASFVGTLTALLLLTYVVFRLVGDWDDIRRGWTVTGEYESTRRTRAVVAPTGTPRATRGDFDGDGVDDELEVVYLVRELLFSAGTRGMLYVRSGASGAVLLAHPLPTPMNAARWCGDIDGDGRDEVWADTPAPGTVFAFVARAAD